MRPAPDRWLARLRGWLFGLALLGLLLTAFCKGYLLFRYY